MSVIDNVALIQFVKAFESELNNDMHAWTTEPSISSSTEINSQNKLSEKAVSQNELATDLSKPRMPNLAGDTKQKPLPEEFFSEFSRTERIFLKKFVFSECDKTDSELQHFLRVLVESKYVFCKLKYDVGKMTQGFHVKLKKMVNYGSNHLSRFPSITGIDWKFSWRNCNEPESIMKWEVM